MKRLAPVRWVVPALSVSLLVATAACSDDSATTAAGGAGGNVASANGGAGGAGAAAAGGNGTGGSGGAGGSGTGGGFNPAGSGGGEPCSNELTGVIRDFQSAHPDFEGVIGLDPGLVEMQIGADLKPVYAGPATGTLTTTGPDNFNQWYRDVAGVNTAIPLTIALTENTPGVYTYTSDAFFPIDGQGFGDEGNTHNYHFTYEIHVEFEYVGGEVFTFTGDDDVFTFINKQLVIDLGGVHGAISQTVDLDALAGSLGIEVGKIYPLDFFFAERHTSESNFRIDTGIACFTEVQPPQ